MESSRRTEMSQPGRPPRHPYGWMFEPLTRLYQQGRITQEKYNQMKQIFRFDLLEPTKQVFCENCGKQIPSDSEFCGHCGDKQGE